jgi:hypothetical protein
MAFEHTRSTDTVEFEQPTGTLERLERQDWWRWTMAAIVTLLLTFGVFTLSLPDLKRNLFEQVRLNLSVTALLGIVLLFDIFALYQQVAITRLRRRLASSIGVMTTLEMLRPPVQQTPPALPVRREFQRFYLDQRIAVKAVVNGREQVIHGRTTDISDGGVGAVIAAPLAVNTSAVIEIVLGGGAKVVVTAVVRHRRGFRHGFQFLGLTPAQIDAIHRACDGAVRFDGLT